MTIRFVVAAPSRSGTTYTARLLTAAGLQCGHEATINRWTPNFQLQADWRDSPHFGECSYVAAPFLDQLDDVVKIHLVRPPLDQIRSALGFAPQPGWDLSDLNVPFVSFINHYAHIDQEPPGPRRAALYWLRWNEMIERAYPDLTWRTTDISREQIEDLAVRVTPDWVPSVTQIEAALAEVPTNTNSRGKTHPRVTLDDLGPHADAVVEAADRYGVPLSADRSAHPSNGPGTDASIDYAEPTADTSPRVVTLELTGGGWYDLKDQEGHVLDRVRGKDAAQVRADELMG